MDNSDKQPLMRVRFHANEEDYRPVVWPVKHPYWCSGSGDGYSILVAYAESLDEIYRLWPEATEIDIMEYTDKYTFTSRFQRPEWLTTLEFPAFDVDTKKTEYPLSSGLKFLNNEGNWESVGSNDFKNYLQKMAGMAGL